MTDETKDKPFDIKSLTIENQCKFYTGLPSETNRECKKDIPYPCNLSGSNADKIKDISCYGCNSDCKEYKTFTPTAIGMAKKGIAERASEYDKEIVKSKVNQQVQVTKQFSGYMPCPVCNAIAEYSLNRYNGTIKITCSTAKCIDI